MVNGLTYNGGVPDVQMSLLHLLELLHEDVIHYHGQIAGVVALAKLVARFELVHAVPHIYDEIV